MRPGSRAKIHFVTLRIGDLFPDIELVDHTGQPWSTADQLGRPLVMVLHRHLA
jgi:peroxiredoxin